MDMIGKEMMPLLKTTLTTLPVKLIPMMMALMMLLKVLLMMTQRTLAV